MRSSFQIAAAMVASIAAATAAFATSPSPYAGMTDREVRALSAEQTADLRAGRGMGLALAAELNGWPGPVHVLEFADHLSLTQGQRARTQALNSRVQTAARGLGERLIAAEADLDTAFRDRTITSAGLYDHLHRIGALQGELRAVHLRAHLDQTDILTADQIAAYNRLRGYADGARDARPVPSGGPHRHGAP